MIALAGLFTVLGVYWAVVSYGLAPLRVAGLGVGVYILRHDVTLLVTALLESGGTAERNHPD
jgi:predicted anti-sigma-YlaC factor YlaD